MYVHISALRFVHILGKYLHLELKHIGEVPQTVFRRDEITSFNVKNLASV